MQKKKSGETENGSLVEKWQDKKGKRTRQKKDKIWKWNQMTVLRF